MSLKWLAYVTFLCTLSLSYEAEKRKGPIVRTCSTQRERLKFLAMNVTDKNNKTSYPVDLKDTVIISLQLNNTGDVLSNITSEVHVSRKTSFWSYVTWIPIPIGSVIKQKIDECKCCPITKGVNVIQMTIDTDKYPIIKKIPLSGEYSMQLKIADQNKTTVELFCGTIEMEIA
ncbi:hypothetical protein M514_09718 [Trichuris suis]|uniref:MD-2-related lipid-recognition domain-containing protein n=1 Tax=Trichuris suis TaxID=68888 RepID=A0A085LWV5_9BILA|nr:hypothetical protein M513_09718 [Trichuris suis]KFD63666.1 hypothetical protein M514_09718 [Trichuris suis]